MADTREISCDLLDVVLDRGAPLDIAMGEHKALAKLDPRDRALVRRIVGATMRRLGEIDAIIKARLNSPLSSRHSRIRNILRAGVAELVFLGTPPHAAVDAAVRVASQYRQGALKGLVNAVLRRIERDKSSGTPISNPENPGESNTPNWLFNRWNASYGLETAEAISAAHLIEAPLDITLSTKVDANAWAKKLEAEILPGGTLRRRSGGLISDITGFQGGQWWIQDAAAALPARLLGDINGKQVIDLCAAPGGKTLQLADAGAEVTAVEITSGRLGLLRENLKRTGLNAMIVNADGVTWRPDTLVDAVLIDAPCSATGTIRRHPDIPRRRKPKDIEAVHDLQQNLLAAAVDMVKPGGVIVFAVCSLEPEEGPAQIKTLLDAGAPVALDPLHPADWPELDGLSPAAITSDGMLRTLPSHWPELGGMDGFFAARLIRN
jgi:16S rRNA (cytosine967-C5)-methyltransferase